jgi:hypothetical protein
MSTPNQTDSRLDLQQMEDASANIRLQIDRVSRELDILEDERRTTEQAWREASSHPSLGELEEQRRTRSIWDHRAELLQSRLQQLSRQFEAVETLRGKIHAALQFEQHRDEVADLSNGIWAAKEVLNQELSRMRERAFLWILVVSIAGSLVAALFMQSNAADAAAIVVFLQGVVVYLEWRPVWRLRSLVHEVDLLYRHMLSRGAP